MRPSWRPSRRAAQIEVDASQLVSAGVMSGDWICWQSPSQTSSTTPHATAPVASDLLPHCSAGQQSVQITDDGPGVAMDALEHLQGAVAALRAIRRDRLGARPGTDPRSVRRARPHRAACRWGAPRPKGAGSAYG